MTAAQNEIDVRDNVTSAMIYNSLQTVGIDIKISTITRANLYFQDTMWQAIANIYFMQDCCLLDWIREPFCEQNNIFVFYFILLL